MAIPKKPIVVYAQCLWKENYTWEVEVWGSSDYDLHTVYIRGTGYADMSFTVNGKEAAITEARDRIWKKVIEGYQPVGGIGADVKIHPEEVSLPKLDPEGISQPLIPDPGDWTWGNRKA